MATRRHYIPAATISDLIVDSLVVNTGATGWIADQLAAIGVDISDLETFQSSAQSDITDLQSDKLDAIINGETIIIGGYLNNDFIETGSIVASKLLLTDIDATSLLNGPAAAGADVTGSNTAKDITNLPDTPVGSGLFATATHLGYYNSGVWRAYIGSDGKALFGSLAGNNYLYWDGSKVTIATDDADGILIKNGGGLTIESGGGISLETGGGITLDGGTIKTAVSPSVSGGCIISPDYIRGYTSAGLKTFEANFSSGLTSGDFYAGDYDSGNPGLKYDHGTGTMQFRGEIIVTGGDVASQTDLTALSTSLGDLAYEDLVELAKLGTTVISGGLIKTELLSASNIQAGTLDCSTITVTNLDASAITTGTLDASLITVDSLNASVITAGTIDVARISGLGADQLAANAVSYNEVFYETPGTTLNTSYQTVHSESITISAAGIIFASATVGIAISGEFGDLGYAKLLIDGTAVGEIATVHSGGSASGEIYGVTISGGLAKTAGTYTVSIQAKVGTAISSCTCSSLSGFIQGIVR